jgi:copper(I)-binding protein
MLAACGAAASPSPGVVVSEAWVRATPTIDQPAAGYLTIANAGSAADALLSVSSPIGAVGIHKSELDSAGMEWMHPVDRVDVPAGATVALAPGGYHLMITGFAAPIAVGQKVELDLTFQHAGRIVVQAEVRAG